MSNQGEQVTIEILDKQYTISCPPGEKQDLLESARILNERLREVRGGGKVLGTERMAVMTALNVILEYNMLQKTRSEVDETLDRLQGKLSHAIGRREQTEAID